MHVSLHQLMPQLTIDLLQNQFNMTGRQFWDAENELFFQFAPMVDMAPMAVRASAWHDIGGFDETAAEKGQCGIMSDWEICHRAWTAGWTVAHSYNPPAMQGRGIANSHVGVQGYLCWQMQQSQTGHVYGPRWGALGDAWCRLAAEHNCAMLSPLQDTVPSACAAL